MDARNADYWRLISELESKAPPSFLRPSTNPDLNGGEHLLSSMDHVIIAGDLNYRIDLPREEVEKMVLDMDSSDNDVKDDSSRHRLKLLRHDQLLKTISQGSAFKDMVEGEIKFAPTFKYDKGTNTYDSSHKLRIPAWTDRILFRPFGVRVQEYDCVPEAIHSDHRPVYATLLMKLEGRHVEETMSPMKKKRKRKRSTNAKKP
jgi:endonuclease/exonuclease/phosphatase family metal-dependent hydrolase